MIKFLDLQKTNAQYSNELKKVACDIIDSGWFLQGDAVKRFEKNLSEFLGVKYVISCANGLDALRLILKAYLELGEMKEGDEVIVPANTYIASILAITDNKLTPVFVEPDEASYNINISKIENCITENTKAIMVVHLYGQTCWSMELEDIAKKHNLKIIEDNAQAIGAKWIDGRRTGNLGNAAGLSFYPGKNLGALGDSGAVSTNDENIANIVRVIANYGSAKKYINEFKGLNSRMDEIQAAFLDIKLKYLDKENAIRSEIANLYNRHIVNPRVKLPELANNYSFSHIWHLFVIRCNDRDKLQHYLIEKNIQTLIHYPIPPHKQKCYAEFKDLSYPLTELIANEVLSLPISPVMEEFEIMRVIDVINEW